MEDGWKWKEGIARKGIFINEGRGKNGGEGLEMKEGTGRKGLFGKEGRGGWNVSGWTDERKWKKGRARREGRKEGRVDKRTKGP